MFPSSSFQWNFAQNSVCISCWSAFSKTLSTSAVNWKQAFVCYCALLSPLRIIINVCRADSVTWNPHKLLAAPQQCSTFLLRQEGLLSACHSASAQYLFQKDKFYDTQYDTGDKHIQCGRRADVLKFWFMWKAKVRKLAMVLYRLLALFWIRSGADISGGLEITNHLFSFSVTSTKCLCLKSKTISQFVDWLMTMNEAKKLFGVL